MLELIFQGFLEWAYGLALECWQYFSTALLDIMSMDFAYLKSHAPVVDEIMQILLAVGWALLIGNLVFQALKSMAVGLGFEGEDPKLLFARTFVFAFLLLASPQICEIGLSMTSKITPNARYTQRPPKQPTGQASPPRAESPHPGTAGMQSAVSAQRPSGEPRPGRNGIPSRTAVSPDARQHSPIRQESRSASAAAAPTLKGTAPNRHPDPAGTAAGVPSASQSRQTVRPSAPSAKSSAQPGKKAVSTTAALKGSVKADGDVKPSRKQRGKKHG